MKLAQIWPMRLHWGLYSLRSIKSVAKNIDTFYCFFSKYFYFFILLIGGIPIHLQDVIKHNNLEFFDQFKIREDFSPLQKTIPFISLLVLSTKCHHARRYYFEREISVFRLYFQLINPEIKEYCAEIQLWCINCHSVYLLDK